MTALAPFAVPLDAQAVCRLLSSHRFNFQDEKALQDGIELVLKTNGIAFKREARLDAQNRPDFLLGSLAIEVKTKGSFADFLRQAQRYLEHDTVASLIVVGTPKWMPLVPPELEGKPIYVVRLLSSLL